MPPPDAYGDQLYLLRFFFCESRETFHYRMGVCTINSSDIVKHARLRFTYMISVRMSGLLYTF